MITMAVIAIIGILAGLLLHALDYFHDPGLAQKKDVEKILKQLQDLDDSMKRRG